MTIVPLMLLSDTPADKMHRGVVQVGHPCGSNAVCNICLGRRPWVSLCVSGSGGRRQSAQNGAVPPGTKRATVPPLAGGAS